MIEYSTLPEASDAIKALNGAKLLDQTIHVDYAFVRPPPSNKGKGGPPKGAAADEVVAGAATEVAAPKLITQEIKLEHRDKEPSVKAHLSSLTPLIYDGPCSDQTVQE